MSSSYNKVILIGNLTRDPEIRYVGGYTILSNVLTVFVKSFEIVKCLSSCIKAR